MLIGTPSRCQKLFALSQYRFFENPLEVPEIAGISLRICSLHTADFSLLCSAVMVVLASIRLSVINDSLQIVRIGDGREERKTVPLNLTEFYLICT